MANLTPTPGWDAVPQLETGTPALGGAGGPMNVQAQALLNRIEQLKLSLDQINFQAPDITSFLVNGTTNRIVEVGSNVTSVAFSWTLAGATPQTQTINQSVGSIIPGNTSLTISGLFTSNRTWTLTVSATDPQGTTRSDTASASLSFMQKRYWGVSASTTLDSAGILALSSEFSSSKNKTITYNATGGRYPYFCYPLTLGSISSATVGGISFSDYSQSTVALTNSSGYTENYNVVRFNTLQNGSNIQVIWA